MHHDHVHIDVMSILRNARLCNTIVIEPAYETSALLSRQAWWTPWMMSTSDDAVTVLCCVVPLPQIRFVVGAMQPPAERNVQKLRTKSLRAKAEPFATLRI